MKIRHFITSLLLITSVAAYAQTAPDFTVTDINGTSHNLYDILNDGKVVVLDVSATWCGPCWSFHQGHYLRDIHQSMGAAGTDQVRVLFYEGDATTTSADLNGTGPATLGDWVTGTDYPIIDETTLSLDLSIYAPIGFPTISVIRPSDKTIVADLFDTFASSGTLQDMKDIITNALGTATAVSTVSTESILVSPNPVQNQLNINFADFDGTVDNVEIVNTLGSVVKSINVNQSVETIDVKDLAKGFYFVRLNSDNRVLGTKKIVKK